ncbi:phosphatidylserine decarboxylase precursor [Robiginitalea myxolifaciens]|uniref:Phosphatidylserine decarboxylase n=1 Tax=Robiginitalea myxolifaciens TaxID=400055 RepID=A0A1I6HLF6_9FLAO|nr:phosphatidylserine decarboxylase [Robiginitalea myxolifaciens]SFR55299.1 phosphatidylserine decarboxylase precursor [Robiginitalea myxolifaciens]
MKYYRNLVLTLLLIIAFVSCDSTKKDVEYGKATKELVLLLEQDPDLKSLLVSSLEKAKGINPDRNTNPAQTLEEYLEFLTWTETTMPWAIVKKEEYPEIFDNIFQGLCAFYFLIDQPLPELEGQGLVNNSLQYYEPFAKWLVTFSQSWGSYLDTEESWNEAYYQMAFDDSNFGLQNGWYEDPSNWKTFNQFFARYLKSPDMRPIANPESDSVVVSFADSEPQGVWAIDSSSNLIAKGGVPVKSATLKSIANLIGEDSQYKDSFASGTFTHSFLNVNDYHRYHFPLGGTIKEARIIQGINPTGGQLWWDEENKRYGFNPGAKTGWQMVETRGCVILETENYGLVALMPIGMAVVNSVNFEENITPGTVVKKGDMLGHFAFGGSDFIMIFQEGVTFRLEAPMQENGNSYEHILMGEKLGVIAK